MSLATDKPEFTPPQQNSGRLRAIGFAVLAHAILIAALTWGVGWQRDSNDAPIQAELWSTTVQEAAPAAVEPPPPPPQPPVEQVKPVLPKPVEPPPKAAEPVPVVDPQIAIEKEKEKKKKLEKIKKEKALAKAKAEEEAEEKRLEELAKKKKLDAKKLAEQKALEKKASDAKEAQEAAKLEAQRKANLERIKGMMGASGGPQSTGTALQSSGPSAGYGGRVIARIKPNIVFTDDVPGNPIASVEVRTAPDGTIIGRRLIKSSGNSAWDNAVLRAIDKTEILPRDIDGRVPSTFEINFRPRD